MPVSFDECFQTVPEWSPPSDFDDFWKSSIQELKSFPIQSQSKTQFRGSIIRESQAEISFSEWKALGYDSGSTEVNCQVSSPSYKSNVSQCAGKGYLP